MKKVLTILAVLVLVAGFAFAIDTPDSSDPIPATGNKETHTIHVSTWVDVTLPVFSFKVDDRVRTNDSATPGKFANNGSYEKTDTAYIRGDSAAPAVGNDIANSDISENFTIYSVSNTANILKAFDFTVTAQKFVHTADANGGAYTTAYDPTIAYSLDGVTATTATEHIAVSLLTTTGENPTTSGIKASFSGHQASNNVLLGTVKVTWPKDVNAVPGAYTADVVLTVTAE